MMLITLQQASDDLRRDTSDDDLDLELKIKAASRAVVTFIKSPSFADSSGAIPEDSAGVAIDVPEDVQAATLLLVRRFYDPDDSAKAFADGLLPPEVRALLIPYRVPTVGLP